MKITWGLENANFIPKTITTLGSYDGVHLGHQKILRRLQERKIEFNLNRSLLITFHPHPQEVLRTHDTPVELLTPIHERLELIEKQGVDETLVITFSREFSRTSYINFFQNTIVKALGTQAMVVGFNHAFGRNREGDTEHLKKLAPELGVTIEELDPVYQDGVSISSSKIRQALKSGDMKNANAWLGRPYQLRGPVIHGDSLGRKLGYPTANLAMDPVKLIPAEGVYAANVSFHGITYQAALSIGFRPTVNSMGGCVVEALILGFKGEIYGEELRVDCLRYLRPQETFADLDELKQAIGQDVSIIRQIETE